MGSHCILALVALVQPAEDPSASVESLLRATPSHRIVQVPRTVDRIRENSLPLPGRFTGDGMLDTLGGLDRFAGHPLEMAPMITGSTAPHEIRGKRYLAFDLEPKEGIEVILAELSPTKIWLDVIEPRIDPAQSMSIRAKGGIRFRNQNREPAVVVVRVEGLAAQAYQVQIRRFR